MTYLAFHGEACVELKGEALRSDSEVTYIALCSGTGVKSVTLRDDSEDHYSKALACKKTIASQSFFSSYELSAPTCLCVYRFP